MCPCLDRDEVHIVIASLLKGRTALHERVGPWLMSVLAFASHRSGSDNDILSFWQALGVDPIVCETLVGLGFFWTGSEITVDSRFENDENLFETVSGCILHLLQWVSFSETRWCKVRRSGCYHVRSMAAGVGPL